MFTSSHSNIQNLQQTPPSSSKHSNHHHSHHHHHYHKYGQHTCSLSKMIDINDEISVIEILTAAQIPLIQLPERTHINPRGKVIKLRLNPCFSLQTIPSAIGKLKHLEEIYLFWGGHDFTALPLSISQLTKLKVLQLRWCQNLHSIPPEIGTNLTNLEELIFEGCTNLQHTSLCFLKDAKTHWTQLKKLQIDNCPLIQTNFDEIFSIPDHEDQDEEDTMMLYTFHH